MVSTRFPRLHWDGHWTGDVLGGWIGLAFRLTLVEAMAGRTIESGTALFSISRFSRRCVVVLCGGEGFYFFFFFFFFGGGGGGVFFFLIGGGF